MKSFFRKTKISLMVAPQCPEGRYWSTENWFDSLYNEVTASYRIDKSRVYVTGISIGGYGTYIVALDHTEKIAAIVPLYGGINDSEGSTSAGMACDNSIESRIYSSATYRNHGVNLLRNMHEVRK